VCSPDADNDEQAATERPAVVVPRSSVFRCGRPDEDLRPASSFIDCRVYLVLLSGTAHGSAWLAEPPQAVELPPGREQRAPPPLPPPESVERSLSLSDADELTTVIPAVEVTADGVLECAASTRSARFSRVSVCRGTTIDSAGSDGSGLPTPASPDFRGGGGGGSVWNACTCQCSCPEKFIYEGPGWGERLRKRLLDFIGGRVKRPFSFPGPLREPGQGTPARLWGGAPERPPFPPPGGGTRGRPPADASSGLVVASDAPAENVFDDIRCPWCGGVREEVPVPDRVEGQPHETREPPQHATPPRARTGAPGSRSFGGNGMPAAPPIHAEAVGDSGVRVPGPDGIRGAGRAARPPETWST
jgi:hypothetical protein